MRFYTVVSSKKSIPCIPMYKHMLTELYDFVLNS